MSSDECRRRGRRTGAAASSSSAVAGRAGGRAKRQTPSPPSPPSPPFPSVCRLVERYTVLIERHLQKQNGLKPRSRRKPSAAGPTGGVTGAGVADGSSDYSSPSKSAGPSSPAFSDDASAWNRLLMDDDGDDRDRDRDDDDDHDDDDDDEPPDDAEHYNHQHVHRLGQQLRGQRKSPQDRQPSERLDDDRRFSCESLGSILPGTYTVPACGFRGGGDRPRVAGISRRR